MCVERAAGIEPTLSTSALIRPLGSGAVVCSLKFSRIVGRGSVQLLSVDDSVIARPSKHVNKNFTNN